MSHKRRAFRVDPSREGSWPGPAASDGVPVDELSARRLALSESAATLEIVAFLKHVQDRLPADSSLRVDLVTLGARLERYRSRL
jgi:hypothetical protein